MTMQKKKSRIAPAYVAKLIKTALDQGWSPSQYGPAFRITT
ncbi:hypothetical protein [Hahella sp. NBU794]